MMTCTPEHGSAEYEKPIFDNDYNIPVTPTSPEITVRFEEPADEMRSSPGSIRENSPEVIPQTNKSYDGTGTDYYMQPDAETNVEQPDPTPTNPRSSKYDLRHNPKPMISVINSVRLPSTERIRTLSGNSRKVLRNLCGQLAYSFKRLAVPLKQLLSITDRRIPIWHLQILGIGFSSKRPHKS